MNIFLKKVKFSAEINIKTLPTQGTKALIPGKTLFSEKPKDETTRMNNPNMKYKSLDLILISSLVKQTNEPAANSNKRNKVK